MSGDVEAPDGVPKAPRTQLSFLAHLRHEIWTSLNAIIGYSEVLLEDAADQGRQDFIPDLERIRASGQQLLALLNDLLAPAKVEASRVELDLEAFGADLREELRAPLDAIIGYSEMLIEDAADQGQESVIADLRKIHAAGEGLLGLIGDLVNLSKTEANDRGLEAEGWGVSARMQGVLSTIHPPNDKRAGSPKTERGLLLVVDDSEVNRDVLSRRLRREGHTVVAAENGAEALRMMRAQQFDLVLLDVRMPEMDGYQVLEHVMAHEAWCEIPVIMISALDELDSAVRCIESGAVDYLPKPFKPVLLRARIGACLEKKRLREAQRAQQKAEEERLRRELEMAELLQARNQELKAFAYTISHDLKAPLRGISGYAHELERRHSTGLSHRALFCISQILTATRNLDRLIEDLLHYSRLETETLTLTDVSLPKSIEAILRDQSRIIAERGVEITSTLPFSTVRGWERGITQMLANLIDNAIKYSRHAAPPSIRITGEELAHAYRMSISDNGIGFDMKYHDRIFGLFTRLVQQEEFEGTGVGLAIAKKVLEKQGGRIWAESRPGAGATFFVELPKM